MNEHSSPQKSPRPCKRAAILRAALQVFAERGVNGVAVPEISALAGVGTGTIYRYFESKEALVNELFREEKQALGRRLFTDVDRNADPHELFCDFWERLLTFIREAPDAYRFLELQDHQPYLDEASREEERRILAPITKTVRMLQEKGIYRSDMRGEVLMAMIWGVVVNLFKSDRIGHLSLVDSDLLAARDACWALLCGPAH